MGFDSPQNLSGNKRVSRRGGAESGAVGDSARDLRRLAKSCDERRKPATPARELAVAVEADEGGDYGHRAGGRILTGRQQLIDQSSSSYHSFQVRPYDVGHAAGFRRRPNLINGLLPSTQTVS